MTALTGTAISRADVPVAHPTPRAEVLTISAFIARVRQDAKLRARFAQNPRGALSEFGIDPGPVSLPDRLTEVQLQSLLDSWIAMVRPVRTADNNELGSGRDLARDLAASPTPPAPVYGPPPSPPVPVYGPPGTPSPKPTGKPPQ